MYIIYIIFTYIQTYKEERERKGLISNKSACLPVCVCLFDRTRRRCGHMNPHFWFPGLPSSARWFILLLFYYCWFIYDLRCCTATAANIPMAKRRKRGWYVGPAGLDQWELDSSQHPDHTLSSRLASSPLPSPRITTDRSLFSSPSL